MPHSLAPLRRLTGWKPKKTVVRKPDMRTTVFFCIPKGVILWNPVKIGKRLKSPVLFDLLVRPSD